MEALMKIRETWLSRKPHPLAALVMAFIMMALVLGSIASWENIAGARDLMSATKDQVFSHHEWWRAWSTLFVHEDGKHLLSNLFLFFILGSFLSAYFGIFFVPFMAFLFGGITNLYVLSGMPAQIQLIGASGVVFWMGGAWLTLYLLLDRTRSLLQRSLRAGGVGLVLFFPAEAFDPNISYKSHWIGFILGILWSLLYFAFRYKQLRRAEVTEIEEVELCCIHSASKS